MPEYIMEKLRMCHSLKPDDKRFDDEILSAPKSEILDDLLVYEGIEGYGRFIIDSVEKIWGVTLGD